MTPGSNPLPPSPPASVPADLPLSVSRGNSHDSDGRHRPVRPKAGHELGDDLADEAGAVVLIGVARHGLGIIALPFTFHRPFHGGQYDE